MRPDVAAGALGMVIGWIAATGTKSQTVRLLDVAVIGPLFVLARPAPEIAAFIGGATMGYNLRNYLAQREEENDDGAATLVHRGGQRPVIAGY